MVHLQALGAFIAQHFIVLFLCMVVYMIIGSIWYGPLFMKPWGRMTGMDKLSDAEKKKVMVPSMFVSLFTAFVIATVLGRGMQLLDMSSPMYPVIIATILWFPFTALPMAQNYAYTKKPWQLLAIDSGYLLVSMWAFSLILYKTVLS